MKTQRIIFLDLARGVAVFLMIMQHSMLMYARDEGAGSALGEFIVLSGTAPAAPVFMLIMGVFFLRAKDMKVSAIRGLRLIGMGYVLNLFRFVLPMVVAGGFPASGPDSVLGQLLTVDILQLAGLSLVCMSLIRRAHPIACAGLGLLVVLISPLLWLQAPQGPLLDLLWGTHKNAVFPLFPWLLYPLMGMFWGSLFNNAASLTRFMRNSALAGVGMMGAGASGWWLLNLPPGDYSRSGPHVHLVIVGFVFVWFWLLSVVEDRVAGTRLADLLTFWSKKVTSIYVIQWVLFGWGVLVFNYQQMTPAAAAVVGIAVALATHWVAKLYQRRRRPET